MKANELRIGNWVNYYLDPPISENQLVEIDISELRNISKGWKNYNPIPLTEEWLKKFGLLQQGSHENNGFCYRNYGKCDRFDITHEWRGTNSFIFSYDVGYGEIEFNVQHVHQLQNIYFALTGEELKLTENENQ